MSDAETAASEGIPETLVEEDEVGKVHCSANYGLGPLDTDTRRFVRFVGKTFGFSEMNIMVLPPDRYPVNI